MGRWIHRLSVDSTGHGTCAECGTVQARLKDGRWKCPTAFKSQRGPRPRGSDKTAEHKRRRLRFLQGDLSCAICNKPLTEEAARVDHDHARCQHPVKGYFAYCAKCVRGVLCSRCNTGLGLYQDSPDLLRRAAAYLEAS